MIDRRHHAREHGRVASARQPIHPIIAALFSDASDEVKVNVTSRCVTCAVRSVARAAPSPRAVCVSHE
jgi:hypothetical protein